MEIAELRKDYASKGGEEESGQVSGSQRQEQMDSSKRMIWFKVFQYCVIACQFP